MKLTINTFTLRLRHTFGISRGKRDVQETVIVTLEEDGFKGHGEATANPYYGTTQANIVAELEKNRARIENYRLDTPENFWEYMHPFLAHFPFAQCALDEAANDLWGKKMKKPLFELWGLSLDNIPMSNYTIGIDTIPKMVEKLEELPWPLYKVKLGTAHDIEIIEALREHTDAVFRIDANCGWTAKDAVAYAKTLKNMGVEFLEQPLPAEDIEGQKYVFENSVLPVIADESCQVESDVKKCHGLFHGINIKLMKCGGLTPARRMIAEAKSLGMKVMVGCMTESTVGISAIAQLLPLLDYVDMDGALLLRDDVAKGVSLRDGKVFFSEANGTGAVLTGL